MQKIVSAPPPGNAVLPLPPLDYDVAYMNQLIRVLNLYFQQLNNPGLINGTALRLSSGDVDQDVLIDTMASNDITKFICAELPTSRSLGLVLNKVSIATTGATVSVTIPVTGLTSLEPAQIWNNGGVLNIEPYSEES